MSTSTSIPLVAPVGIRRSFVFRFVQCVLGLACFGVGIALIFSAELGRAPWDVLHEGISRHTGIDVGVVMMLVGGAVLALWIPLRERPGLGTLLNAVVIGAVFELVSPHLPETDRLIPRVALLVAGILVVGAGSGIYIRAALGAGPRDGLMTGLARISPLSIRAARTLVEVSALLLGIVLGGRFGVATVTFALAIGPVVQTALKLTDALLGTAPPPAHDSAVPAPSTDAEAY